MFASAVALVCQGLQDAEKMMINKNKSRDNILRGILISMENFERPTEII
jgi:hypothetical protein